MEGWKEGGREGQREREQREIAGAHASARVREQYFYFRFVDDLQAIFVLSSE